MRIMDIDIEKVRAQAKQTFPDQFIQIETGSLFIPDSEAGTYTCDYMEDLLYISTCMGYHEVMIKGNKTRVKVEITLVFLKERRILMRSFMKGQNVAAVMWHWRMESRFLLFLMISFY